MADIIKGPRGFQKAASNLSAEELDSPVLAEEPQEVKEADKPLDEVQAQEQPITPQEQPVQEEQAVPRSRFVTMHQRAVEAERKLRQHEAEREFTPQREERTADVDGLTEADWIATFGDTEQTRKAFQLELKRTAALEEKAAQRAYERLQQEQDYRGQHESEVVQQFDDEFENLEVATGKEFDDDAQVAMLDIVEEYSPKDDRGNLIREYLIPMDKAYEIYQLRQTLSQSKRSQDRAEATDLTSVRSKAGSPSGQSSSDWKPGFGNRQYERKLG